MTDREKAINVLSNYKGHAFGDKDEKVTLEEIIALLKAQEPRIVTEADFENADEAGFIPAWCEEKDTGEVYCECISIGALEDAKFGHVRWWTFRPTDKQMEATPWTQTNGL